MTRNRLNVPFAARLAIVTAGLVVLSACSSSGKHAGSVASTSSVSPQTSTTTEARPSTTSATAATGTNHQLVSAVRAFWDLYLQLGARPGPFDPSYTRTRLGERATGKELSQLFEVLQGNAAAGEVVRGSIDIAPTVVSAAKPTAQVRDCYDDRTGLYRASDGKRLDTEDRRRHAVLMTLVRDKGAWKVSAIKNEGLGCAA